MPFAMVPTGFFESVYGGAYTDTVLDVAFATYRLPPASKQSAIGPPKRPGNGTPTLALVTGGAYIVTVFVSKFETNTYPAYGPGFVLTARPSGLVMPEVITIEGSWPSVNGGE